MLRPYLVPEIDHCPNDMPLGMLSRLQILKGINVLKKMRLHLGNKKLMIDYTNNFFSIIPHTFGRKSPEPFKNTEQINEKIELLNGWMNQSVQEMLSI